MGLKSILCKRSQWHDIILLYPSTINHVHTPSHTSRSLYALWAAVLVCLCLCPCGRYTSTRSQVCVCTQRFVCVRVFDLLTHVFNWNSIQSVYRYKNRICTWWCQPKFLRGLFECAALSYSQTEPSGSLAGNSSRNWKCPSAAPGHLIDMCFYINSWLFYLLSTVICFMMYVKHGKLKKTSIWWCLIRTQESGLI